MKQIYLDNASTTSVDPRVVKAMLPYFSEIYGNADSLHELGLKAKQAIDKSRKEISEILNCKPEEIIFTSGGTEANNLAIFGITKVAQSGDKKIIITSKVEHSSILKPCEELSKEGAEIIYIDVNQNGIVDLSALEKNLKNGAALASIMYANNEIGTIEPVKEIGALCRKYGVPFHTDACQAAEYLSLDTQKLNVDLMTLNAGKVYGPKGIGALFVRNGIKIKPLIFGGGQERDLRGGTMNTPLIVGFAEALKLAEKAKKSESERLTKLRDNLIKVLLESMPKARLNGDRKNRLPNNINITIPKIEGKELLFMLSENGIYVSTGSACESSSKNPSHVLKAIGVENDFARCALRITLGKNTTEEEISYAIKTILKIVKIWQKS